MELPNNAVLRWTAEQIDWHYSAPGKPKRARSRASTAPRRVSEENLFVRLGEAGWIIGALCR
jgi:hypothetical protein